MAQKTEPHVLVADEHKIIDGKLEVLLSPEEIAGILEAYPDVTIRIEK